VLGGKEKNTKIRGRGSNRYILTGGENNFVRPGKIRTNPEGITPEEGRTHNILVKEGRKGSPDHRGRGVIPRKNTQLLVALVKENVSCLKRKEKREKRGE